MAGSDESITAALDNSAVRLTFEVGGQTLTVAELARLEAGFVFSARVPVERPVLIRANGVPFGRGELVRIDDALAVRLLEGDGDAA
jgi:type III secretion protein Q